MISAHLLAVYIAALFVVYAVPGPDMALVLQTSIGRGVRSGFAAAGGLGLARATHVTLSACGVAALLRSAPWLYDVVRYGGAVYLAWVGIQIFRSPVFALPDGTTAATPAGAAASIESRPLRAAFVKGLLTNLLNPKIGVFYISFLPQFLPAGVAAAPFIFLLAALHVLMSFVWFAVLIGATRPISGWLQRAAVVRWLDRVTGAVFLGFGLRLALDRR